MPTVSSTRHHADATITAARDRRIAALLAAALGIIILVGVGFAPGAAHDAAHDTRHAVAFPCH
ncbi:MAG: CbtB-domain containing protein [Gammaproteobacteria bacterium]|nr:CbtB-domain containing protein [Gammaproteobacteria bacterium]